MTSVYRHNYYGASHEPMGNEAWFCNCCGASYIAKPKPDAKVSPAHKGIRVWAGAVGAPYKGPKQTVDHLVTRNGTITVSVRHDF
jgi:hypothetical protein